MSVKPLGVSGFACTCLALLFLGIESSDCVIPPVVVATVFLSFSDWQKQHKAATKHNRNFIENQFILLLTVKKLLFMALFLKGIYACAQTPYPGQPETGPGGAEYSHRSVAFFDHAQRADGYWLFEPADPKPDSADVVVFLHGYGAYNPMAYGKWIKHLVARGNIVIYPRYQRNLLTPRPSKFPANAAKGIHDALLALAAEGHPKPRLEKVAYVAHSYGGVIAANLGVHWEELGIPKPSAMLLAEPGSGPFKGARLENYAGLPSDLHLIVIVGEHDFVVGEEFGRRVFETAVNTPNRNFVRHYRCVNPDSTRAVGATHSEPYSYDLDFDIGVRNFTAKRVLLTSRLNEVDFNCYWKLADALIECTRTGCWREYAFGKTPQQCFLGCWPDGTLMRELEVILPGNPIPYVQHHMH